MTVASASDLDTLAKEISEIAQTHDLTRRVTITGSRAEIRVAVSMNQLLDGLSAREKHLRTMMDTMKDASDDAQTANKLLKRVKDELKARKVQLADAVAKASAANTAKSQFLANMSHEIRTPMNGILGTAELLARTQMEPKQQKYVGTIIRSGRALLTIINDILDFSKVESGKIDLAVAPFDLVQCINDVIALLTPTCTAKEIGLNLIVEPDLPHAFSGDVGRIRQILTNIIGNSVKFTDAGSVTVTLTGQTVDGKTVLRIEVRDTGIGIPANKVNDVFEKFSQVDNTSARRHEGTGLGLAISKSLIERMGGNIGVESTVGVGSMFWFTLPLPVYEQPAVVAEAALDINLEGRRILMVARNDTEATPARALMQALGCDVRTVLSPIGQSAIDGFLDGSGHLIVVLESQETSEAFLREIADLRALRPPARLSIMAVTAAGTNEEAAKYVDAGAQGYLNGDLHADEVREAVETVLRNAAEGTSQLVTRYSLDEDRRTRAAPQDTGPTIDPIAAGRNKVLLVEDSLVNQEVARDFLESMGCVVEVARNGREAVDAVARQAFDAVLMDCQMPVMDGFQATRAIRESEMSAQSPRVPIIALTANAFESDQKKCMAAGMSDFLSKPFDPDQFEATVRKWLSRPDNVTHGEVMPQLLAELEQGEPAEPDPDEHHLYEIRMAFEAWSSASNDAARSLLLSGPILTIAEGLLRARPHDLSDDEQSYILRSLAAQTRRGVSVRAVREVEPPQRGSHMNWMVVAILAIGALGASMIFGRDVVEWALDRSGAPQEVATPLPTPDLPPSVDVAAAPVVEPPPASGSASPPTLPSPAPSIMAAPAPAVVPMPAPAPPIAAAPGIAPEPTRAAGESPKIVLSIPPVPETATPARRAATLDDIRTLTALSKTAADSGDTRAAVLLAVEAWREAGMNGALLADVSVTRQMYTSLLRALMTRTIASAGPDTGARGVAVAECRDGSRPRPTPTESSALSGKSTMVDPVCGRRLVNTTDYGIQVVSNEGDRVQATLLGHQSEIVSAAFDPTGRTVLTASRDATARIWDSRTGRTLATLAGHDYALAGAVFNSDGHHILTWSEDKTARLWEARSGRQIAVIRGHQGPVTSASFSLDDQLVLTTSNDGSARVWSASTGTSLATLLPDKSSAKTAEFSRDGSRVVTQQHTGSIALWDVVTGAVLATIVDPAGTPRELGFSPDGRWLVTVSTNGTTTLWNAESGASLAELHRPDQRPSAGVTFTADGARVLARARDGTQTSWPTIDELQNATERALRTIGACLSARERSDLKLSPVAPDWCADRAEQSLTR